MNAKIMGRLDRLEKSGRTLHAGVLDQIVTAALQAISDEDLQILHDLGVRGGRWEDCSPEQRAAVRQYGAEWDAAASKVLGRRLDDLDVKARIAEMARITDLSGSRAAAPPPLRRRSRRSMRGFPAYRFST
jgi:hypothetical protein